MQKNRALIMSVLAAVLLSSAALSVAAAQETIPPATPDPSAAPEPSVDPEAADKADQNQFGPNDPNATSPDTPLNSGDPILYAMDDNNTDALAPGAADANLLAEQASPDYTLPIAAIGILSAVIIGGVFGVVYFRRQAKTEN
jgi:hypothetical protein